jgi:hypothetical protein
MILGSYPNRYRGTAYVAKIFEKASRLTGVKEKTSLVRLGLEALIARESSRRLAKLGGTEDNLSFIPRRRSA